MSPYTASEYTDMIIAYGIAGENARAAARVYAERFPGRTRHPDSKTITNCIQRARETGSVLRNQQCLELPVHISVKDEERILEAFEENPKSSVRHLSRVLGITRYCVDRVLRENDLLPTRHSQESEEEEEEEEDSHS